MNQVNDDGQSTKVDRSDNRRRLYRATPESEARVLLLIDQFSRTARGRERFLEGRVKLAKLDFLIRYPRHFSRVIEACGATATDLASLDKTDFPLDARMMRYRYGPWDPSYYAILGSLIGRGLVVVSPLAGRSGFGYRTSSLGEQVSNELRLDESFEQTVQRLRLARKYLDKSGTTLKNYLYELPEIADANWHEELI